MSELEDIPVNSAVALLLAAQVAAGATLRRAEPGTSSEALTPAVAEAAAEIVRLAVRESSEDTDFPRAVVAAIDHTSTHVRQNAYASISVAVRSHRNSQTPRAPGRLAYLVQTLRPTVLAGVRDPDGPVRRYALMALIALDTGTTTEMASTVDLAGRLFRLDPEPSVRVAALDLLLSESRSRGRNWTLIEEALKDPSPSVKSAAFREASSAGAVEAIPYLLRGLNDESDQWTRLSAANALQAFVVTNPEVVDAVEARVAIESNQYIKDQLSHLLAQMRLRRK